MLSLETGSIHPGSPTTMEVEGIGTVRVENDLTAKELEIIRAGGLLNLVRQSRA